jgi:phage gp46-like protein
MNLTIHDQACPPTAYLLWDTIWNATTQSGDWALAGPAEFGNPGGLAATRPIETAILLALFTDRRCPDDHPLAWLIEDGDPRGWWGDGVDLRADLGETPMGSLLWLLERATATADNARWARAFAEEALAPLVAAGLFASVAVDAQAYPARAAIVLAIDVVGRDGRKAYANQFDVLWAARR